MTRQESIIRKDQVTGRETKGGAASPRTCLPDSNQRAYQPAGTGIGRATDEGRSQQPGSQWPSYPLPTGCAQDKSRETNEAHVPCASMAPRPAVGSSEEGLGFLQGTGRVRGPPEPSGQHGSRQPDVVESPGTRTTKVSGSPLFPLQSGRCPSDDWLTTCEAAAGADCAGSWPLRESGSTWTGDSLVHAGAGFS